MAAALNFDEIPTDEDGFITGDSIIFEDDYHKLSSRKLELKDYFFPSRQSRFINLREIKTVYFKKQKKSDFVTTKMWGLCGTKVWWASDMKRGLRFSDQTTFTNVVIDCGERMLKGFTVTDFDVFRKTIEQATNGVTFISKLPELF